MDSGQPHDLETRSLPRKMCFDFNSDLDKSDDLYSDVDRIRPTLQLKIKANSWNGFRPTPPPDRLRPTLQLKIKANSWNGFR